MVREARAMAQLTRRNLLKKSSAGALVLGALAAVPGGAALAAEGHVAEAEAHATGLAKATPFVAYVRNPRAGELVLIVGAEEITIQDKALVAKLWNIQSKHSHHAK